MLPLMVLGETHNFYFAFRVHYHVLAASIFEPFITMDKILHLGGAMFNFILKKLILLVQYC